MQTAARKELARRELLRRRCAQHPAWWLDQVQAFDERAAEPFSFHLTDPEHPWYWQREVLDELMEHQRVIILKARQLGITWLTAGRSMWRAVWRPGSTCLVYRQKEDDAVDVVCRMWDMYQSSPEWLRNGSEVTRPLRARPSRAGIELVFPDGRVSRVLPMTGAVSSGHGYAAADILLDEFAYMENAEGIVKAISSAAGTVGTVAVVSTANGTADAEGNGNGFAYLWNNADESGMRKLFLGWQRHPDRDQNWYDTSPEVRNLRPHQRAEQYPSNEHEAFLMTGRPFFDVEALSWYAERPLKELYRAEFRENPISARSAALKRDKNGPIRVFHEPKQGRYGIGADVATGRGKDYSVAYVINLDEMRIEAEYHAKSPPDVFAAQLHYLGKWYSDALIAIETAGGFGEAVIIGLRDGKLGRPPYPHLYRHIMSGRPDLPMMKTFGFPTNTKTRPAIVNNMERIVREKVLPALPDGLMHEMRGFVIRDQPPSPAGANGINDDRVMAMCISLWLYHQKGVHPKKAQRELKKKGYSPAYPWQRKVAVNE